MSSCSCGNEGQDGFVRALVIAECAYLPPQHVSSRARLCPSLAPTALKTVLGPVNVWTIQIEPEDQDNGMKVPHVAQEPVS